jgi:hypothetical protein
MITLDISKSQSYLDLLPNEIITYLMCFLDIKSFQALLRTCRKISKFQNDDRIWKHIAENNPRMSHIYDVKPPNVNYKWLCLAYDNGPNYNSHGYYVYGHSKIGLLGTFDEDDILISTVNIEHGTAISKKDNKILSGIFEDGKLHGFGLCHWSNGDKYTGEWRKGKRHGKGYMIWGNGESYDGEWFKNSRTGYGVYKWNDGSYFKGNFMDGEVNGYGIYLWKGGKYKGHCKNSCKDGKGKIKWNNGDQFEGEFKMNMKEGYGVYKWANGNIYGGYWNSDGKSGHGHIKYTNGMEYIGNFLNDERNGDGKLYWPNGEYYVGKWRNGSRSGYGIFYKFDPDRKEMKSEQQYWKSENIDYGYEFPAQYP